MNELVYHGKLLFVWCLSIKEVAIVTSVVTTIAGGWASALLIVRVVIGPTLVTSTSFIASTTAPTASSVWPIIIPIVVTVLVQILLRVVVAEINAFIIKQLLLLLWLLLLLRLVP